MVLFVFTLALFSLFFYEIWLRYLWLIPVIIFIWLMGFYTSTVKLKLESFNILEKYWVVIAWVIMLLWFGGVFHFFWISLEQNLVSILWINMVLWLISYVISYKDGKIAGQFWYYISIITILLLLFLQYNFTTVLSGFSYLWVLTLWVTAFILFILGIRHEIEKYIWYKLFVLIVWWIVLFVFKVTSDYFLALLLSELVLSWIFLLIYFVSQKQGYRQIDKKEISLRRILAWEKITSQTSIFQKPRFSHVQDFVKKMPKWAKYILEISNSLLVLSLIIMHTLQLSKWASQSHHIIFWLVISLFVFNVISLKKSWYTSIIQKLILFLVVNFAIYISLLSIFQTDISKVALRWVVRNIFSWVMIFYAHKTPISRLLEKRDYTFRLITTVLALITNIFLMTKTQIDKQLIFSLAVVYLWLQSFILFNGSRYIKSMKNSS